MIPTRLGDRRDVNSESDERPGEPVSPLVTPVEHLAAAVSNAWYFHSGRVLRSGVEERGLAVAVEGARIVAVGKPAERLAKKHAARFRRVSLRGASLAPGFIDLHTHGALGVDFNHTQPGDLERVVREHYLPHGVTRFLASLYPASKRELLAAIRRVAGAIRDGEGLGVAVGIHLEGPFLDPGHPGSLPARYFRKYSPTFLEELLDVGDGLVRTMTIAPERPGAADLIRHLKKRGVVVAVGHTGADLETARAAIKQGVRYVTHLFNAMPGIHHRQPGPIPAFLEDPRVRVELISDGIHLHPEILRSVALAKSADQICLVSDSTIPCGLRSGRYRFAGQEVELRAGRITTREGALAGSALTLDQAFRVQVESVGLPAGRVSVSASHTPARICGWHRRVGDILPGMRADLVVLDRQLRVRETFLGGQRVYPC